MSIMDSLDIYHVIRDIGPCSHARLAVLYSSEFLLKHDESASSQSPGPGRIA